MSLRVPGAAGGKAPRDPGSPRNFKCQVWKFWSGDRRLGRRVARLAAAPSLSIVARLRESGKEDDSERLGVSGPEPRRDGAQAQEGWEDDGSIKTALTRTTCDKGGTEPHLSII